jgi:hypothetical protein
MVDFKMSKTFEVFKTSEVSVRGRTKNILIRSNSPLGSTFCHSRGSNRESSLLNP